ncbi:MAG TPA: LexA family transcriptional regulator [Methylomirabilota bacterium]|jgi:phage repressor protein C with HTH and peptisase S24 domain|nr:LexA family transcriptional regulator [Methylomirabilota bacterium]HZT35947.1 LexA family transcriptional regulator [Nitrososphaera sp.]
MGQKYPALSKNLKKIRYLAGERLGLYKKTGERKSLSVKEVARRIQKSLSAVGSWERGVKDKHPNPNDIQAICWVFDVQPEALLFGKIEKLGPNALIRAWPPAPVPLQQTEENTTSEVEKEYFPVPIISGRIFGDNGKYLFSDLTPDNRTALVPTPLLRSPQRNAYGVFTVASDSMLPLLPPGTSLLVNTSRRDPALLVGRVVVIQIDQEAALVKVLSRDDQGRYILRSLNQEKYADKVLEQEPIQIAAVEAFARDEGSNWQSCDMPISKLLRGPVDGITAHEAEETLLRLDVMYDHLEKLLRLVKEESQDVHTLFRRLGLIDKEKKTTMHQAHQAYERHSKIKTA